MARQPMITRNVKAYECVIFGVNRETEETETRTFTVSAKLKDDKAILKAIAAQGDKFIPLEVREKTERETLYGMSETEFISIAKIMPPRKKNN